MCCYHGAAAAMLPHFGVTVVAALALLFYPWFSCASSGFPCLAALLARQFVDMSRLRLEVRAVAAVLA